MRETSVTFPILFPPGSGCHVRTRKVPEQEIEPPSPGGRQNMWILNERILTFYVEMKSAELPYALHAASPNVSEHLLDLTIVQR